MMRLAASVFLSAFVGVAAFSLAGQPKSALAQKKESASSEKGNSRMKNDVRIVVKEAARRADVLVDGRPFTSYIWADTLKKPVLYPLRTSAGTIVTRGYPLEPRPGERVDHPHHVGLWFNYGDVNGLDFWNNSDAVKPQDRHKYGSIRHTRIKRTAGGRNRGTLEVEMDWVAPDGKVLLREETTFVFHAAAGMRAIDRFTKLTALDARVSLNDNKEGLLGMRVARQLEQPAQKAELFTDASGKATSVPTLDNTGVTGQYLSSEGKTGDAVWGTRGRWAVLTGKIADEPIAVAVLDHPKNPGHPTYWHARGYGLFAANNLGQRALSGGKEELKFALESKQSVLFRHRVLIQSGVLTPDQMETHYRQFTEDVK